MSLNSYSDLSSTPNELTIFLLQTPLRPRSRPKGGSKMTPSGPFAQVMLKKKTRRECVVLANGGERRMGGVCEDSSWSMYMHCAAFVINVLLRDCLKRKICVSRK